MEFYFAINDEMVAKFGMSQNNDKSFSWKLNENSYMKNIIAETPGKLLDLLFKKGINCKQPLHLCKATIPIELFCEILNAAMINDRYSNINVIVAEVVYVTDIKFK